MLSIGWTEMMVVAAIALIVVGPKDLPAMLRHIGKVAGTVRRMGNEFKAELNKVTAMDEIRDIKKSISAPLNETRSKIESEFNTILPDGTVKPSGVIKPAKPGAESVVDEIRSNAGMDSPLEDTGQAARDSIGAAVTRATQSAAKPAGAKSGKGASSKAAQGKAMVSKRGGGSKTTKARPAKAKAGAGKASVTKAKTAKRADAKAGMGAKPAPKPRARTAKPGASTAGPSAAKATATRAKPAPAKRATPKPAKGNATADQIS